MAIKVLIVDDDEILRQELRSMLSDFDVVEAAMGQDAVRMVKKEGDIDIVLLDIRMPGISGLETLRQIKDVDPVTGIIMMTGYGSKETILQSLRRQADDYLEKPIDPVFLRERIEVLAKKKGRARERAVLSIEAKIDRLKRLIERDYAKNISLKAASEVTCLSPKYLSRVFREHSGCGFSKFKVSAKMKKAKDLLADGDLHVNEIASVIGYTNVESFVRIFKRSVGLTPSEFRGRRAARRGRRRAKRSGSRRS